MTRKYTWIHMAMTGAILAGALLYARALRAEIPEDKSAAVVFVYQRVGEESVPQGNISLDQFKEHINELKKDGYTVLPLGKVVDAVKNGDTLPPKSVAITFEGAYQTTLANVVPLLQEEQMPFTIFFASDMVENDGTGRMSWDQIKALHKDKLASFGLLPASYEHMVDLTPEKNAEIINRGVARYREVMGEDPVFFSYPYGEYNIALKKQLASYKFKAVFGQQSGVIYKDSDFMALPRFTMTDDFGDLDRFMLTANALPLPVSDVVPEDTVVTQNPPTIGFTIAPGVKNLGKLSCFASGLGKLPITRIGASRIEIRPAEPFTDRRTRINCTLPNDVVTPGEPQNWRWFGMLLTTPALEEDDEETETPAEQLEGSSDGDDSQNTEKK